MWPMDPAGEYGAGRLARPPLLLGGRGKPVLPGDDRVLREDGDALARGDADLDRVLDATRDRGDAVGHHVTATRGVALGALRLALELVARGGAAALEAADVALELPARLGPRGPAVDQLGGGADDAVTRREGRADVD